MLPAAQLLTAVGGRAGGVGGVGVGGRDYNAAKAVFLSALEADGLVLEDLRLQVRVGAGGPQAAGEGGG